MPNITLTQQIIEYVRAHPGSSRADIIDGISFEGPPLQISTMLGRLKREGALRSEGPYPKLNRWFPIEISASEKYQKIAHEILDELKSIRREFQQEHLARRLEELFEN